MQFAKETWLISVNVTAVSGIHRTDKPIKICNSQKIAEIVLKDPTF